MGATGIVRDDLFMEHITSQWHPESPERLKAIYRVLDGMGNSNLKTLDRRLASPEEITLVHQPQHFEKIAKTEGRSRASLDADTQTSAMSYQAALAAAGGLIDLTGKVLDGELDNGFALVRPPGHHAESYRAMGFCLFNNVAVAAAWALKHRNLSRVMIVDWDLHHGNGTQHSFFSDPRVLYVSTHQYPFYPGTGALGETGKGQGLGYNINIPLSWGHGDAEYVSIFQKIVRPAAEVYRPEVILVSAGFDIYRDDPLGEMKVTVEGFAALARILKQTAEKVCGGRLVLTLEGGYDVEGQAAGVGRVLDVLTGDPEAGRKMAESDPPEPAIIDQVRRIQANFWPML